MARHLFGEPLSWDPQVRIDLAIDFMRAGLIEEAIDVLRSAGGTDANGAGPLIEYYLGHLHALRGDTEAATRHRARAAAATPDYCFPSRLEDIAVLTSAIAADPKDARAPYYLGNLLYDRRRHREAIRLWEQSARLGSGFPVVWRNLGIGYFNILNDPAKARRAFDKALNANPTDARILYERDQLWKRLGEAPERRLAELEQRQALVEQRDDLSVELAALYNQTGRHDKALAVIERRRFQPWEGGEGLALGQHVRTHLALGRAALGRGDAVQARRLFERATESPENLGEARHVLANASDIHYWLGMACEAVGDPAAAEEHWVRAASFRGDFQEMSVRAFSEMTYYSALALRRLGKTGEARKLLHDLLAYAGQPRRATPKIDYFATSLPAMLLFEDDLARRNAITAAFLAAQANLGLGRTTQARRLLKRTLDMDCNHAMAADLLAELPAHTDWPQPRHRARQRPRAADRASRHHR
jgi:tetratricopeptide (TPR) repeat protein